MMKFISFHFKTALRATIINGKGDCNPSKLAEFQHIMRSLWEELSDLADFDKVCIHPSRESAAIEKNKNSFYD